MVAALVPAVLAVVPAAAETVVVILARVPAMVPATATKSVILKCVVMISTPTYVISSAFWVTVDMCKYVTEPSEGVTEKAEGPAAECLSIRNRRVVIPRIVGWLLITASTSALLSLFTLRTRSASLQ